MDDEKWFESVFRDTQKDQRLVIDQCFHKRVVNYDICVIEVKDLIWRSILRQIYGEKLLLLENLDLPFVTVALQSETIEALLAKGAPDAAEYICAPVDEQYVKVFILSRNKIYVNTQPVLTTQCACDFDRLQ